MPTLHEFKKHVNGLPAARGDRIKPHSSAPIHPAIANRIQNKQKTQHLAVISAPLCNDSSDNRPHARVRIFDDELVGLLDSGANITVLGRDSDK